MLVLAIDTALEFCAAAVLDTGSEQFLARESQAMKRGHAEALMPLIARVMADAALPFTELDRIAVTTGPGSFTGLRVGISAARGLALAADKPVVGVSTLAAYAAPLVDDSGEEPIVVAIDARHDHVYTQTFSGRGATLIKPAVMPVDEALRAARFGAPRLVGNAAQILAARWSAQAEAPLLVETRPGPDIGWVAWIGAAAQPETAPARPFYLRAPDAKPQAAKSGVHAGMQPQG
ncbi:MAG: tRNA (adenosine(37)-N6)-threonylcarbamoyltransferase complex dimerization subunit type 1 TsaB [Afipia sp.]|nr:tRNA (adenosine(37)-N6)-threonylcarbamoyltransferase complex dimerization subunit type 1 TsaB [Afipia sp.]OJW63673.1 MAG: tRNA (adenosine(37)-N6)-threonylcarbamoyltransferase complex dimerization subunit type 1 TsaB [Afipia sp. 64-13]